MKKTIICMFMLLCSMASLAQNGASENLTGEWLVGNEVQFRYNPEVKNCFGLRYGFGFNNWLNGDIVLDNVFEKHGAGVYRAGVGPGGKYAVGPLVFSATAFPYAGFTSSEEIKGNGEYGDFKFKFAYGAMAHVNIGFKVSKNYYISGGYSVEANEFKTNGMFKYGTWQIGITVIE